MPTKFTRKLSDRGDNTCVAVRLPIDWRMRLQELADQKETVVSALIRLAIIRYLANEPDLEKVRAIAEDELTVIDAKIGLWISNDHRERLTGIARKATGRDNLSVMVRLAIAHYLGDQGGAIAKDELGEKKDYTPITAKLLKEEKDAFRKAAAEKGVTPSFLVRSLVQEFLQKSA